jgi:DNA-binding winged helix-turn-helix (wHTH) protein
VLEFRVLGPLEVWREGQSIELPGSKRRAALALLVLHANEVVRTHRLIEDLWGEKLPANASAALHNHVSRLRKELGSEVIATKPWGYVLRTDPDAIDLEHFERLVVEAKPLAARERKAKLTEALALWRGPALADLGHEPAWALEIERLEELRLSALEQRIDADLERSSGRTRRSRPRLRRPSRWIRSGRGRAGVGRGRRSSSPASYCWRAERLRPRCSLSTTSRPRRPPPGRLSKARSTHPQRLGSPSRSSPRRGTLPRSRQRVQSRLRASLTRAARRIK